MNSLRQRVRIGHWSRVNTGDWKTARPRHLSVRAGIPVKHNKQYRSAMSEHGFFNVNGRSIYCGIYLPASGKVSTAAVICEPFGEEKRCAFRMLTRLAVRLSEAGIAVMRFDLSGTGDSSCSHDDATWNNWQEELTGAIDVIKKVSGAGKVVVLGFRAGALLASNGAANGQCQALSLIEPVLSGSELLNDLERRQKIKEMMASGAEGAKSDLPDGCRDFGGFVVNSSMSGQMGHANLGADLEKIAADVPIQLIRVSGGKAFPPAWKFLVEKAQASKGGEALLVQDKPFWGQVDYFESDSVIDPVVHFCL